MTRGYDEILDEELKTLSKEQRRDLAVANMTPSEFEDWKALEIAKADAIRKIEAEEAAQAQPAPKPDGPDFFGMSNDEFNRWKSDNGYNRHQRDVLETVLSDEFMPKEKKTDDA
jgi:hypothetical protein